MRYTSTSRRFRSSRSRTPPTWRDGRYVALDLETTGLNPRSDAIVAWATVPIVDGKIRPAESASSFLRVDRPISPSSTKVHGIRTSDVSDAEPMEHGIRRLADQLADATLVIHGRAVDMPFLRRAMKRSGRYFQPHIIDTADLATQLLEIRITDGHIISLEYAANALNLPVIAPHTALGDALTTAHVFVAAATLLNDRTARRQAGHE